MDVSEEGFPTGSIDVSALDEIKPKSDEAKAEVAALKARRDAGLEQVAADEERLAEAVKVQSEAGHEPAKDEKKPEPVKAAESKPAEKKG